MSKKIYINGMASSHCTGVVKKALLEICGVKSVSINLSERSATIKIKHEVENKEIVDVLSTKGYEVTSIQ